MTRASLVSGGGNDFLALLEPAADPARGQIVAWCARGVSVGADGVFVLRRREPGRVEMRHWNADGHPAALCINATRCAARLALRAGWGDDGRVAIETGAGPLAARAAGATSIRLELPAPGSPPTPLALEIDGVPIEGWFLTVGVAHFVVLRDGSLADCPVVELGSRLRAHSSFGAEGTNADFVRFLDPHRLEIRTFERGVEAETLACGSGVLAAVAVGLRLNRARLPVRALTRGGFELEVAADTAGPAPGRWTLAGDARVLGEIELSDEAGLPPPLRPDWSA